jgi:hypothetical protein
MSCAQCEGIEDEFDEANIRKKFRRYRRRGPDRTTRLLIEDLRRALLRRSRVGDASGLRVWVAARAVLRGRGRGSRAGSVR